MTDNRGYVGHDTIYTGGNHFSQLEFVARQVLAKAATAQLVQIVAVTNAGEASPVGFVDVRPMVHQIDGKGQPTPHGVIRNLPYLRMQGGSNAIIIDPQVGDIGLASFCARDISVVKKTKKPSVPGSRRQNDWADGIYHGGMLNGSPSQMVRFAADGVHIESPNDIHLHSTGGNIILDGHNVQLDASGNFATTGGIVAGVGGADQVNVQTHFHSGVQPGGGNSSSPVPGT